MTTSKGIDSYKLKITALIFMVIDHVYTYLNAPIHGYQTDGMWPQWIQLLARFVSPLFLYLMIEGFYHTRDRRKFLTRLLVTGLIMMAGNMLINYIFHNVDQSTGMYSFRSLIEGHDIFLTLADLFAFVWCLDNIKNKKRIGMSILITVITAFLCLFLEGGFYLLPITVIFWYFHGKKPQQCIGIAVWNAVLLIHALISYLGGDAGCSLYSHLCFDNEWAMLPVIFFILMYNGERGRNTKFTKYMFYVIYPLHLWILMIIRFILV